MKLTKITLVYILCGIKLLMHFLTNTKYGLHRDEYLYWVDGQHLDWGFVEIPPFTAFIAYIAEALGGSPFILRLFPALAGTISVYIVGKLVIKLGGKRWAIFLAGLALILSPALCWSNTLFQPVSFNQLFWLLLAYTIICYIEAPKTRIALGIGLVLGLGIINKYSILFYGAALFGGILLSSSRKILWNKDFLIAMGISFMLILPNIIWQFQHNFPVVQHMHELRETQLQLISSIDFVLPLFFFFMPAMVIWIMGLIFVFRDNQIKKYRFVGWGFFLVILIVWLLRGKAYYLIGSFTILIPFGAVFFEKTFTKRLQLAMAGVMVLIFLPMSPYSLPLLSLPNLKDYCTYMAEHYNFTAPLRWENGRIYPIPQDMADMHGWEEIPQKVAKIYHGLPPEKKSKCMIYAGSYGHAGVISYYREKYDLPEPASFSAGFLKWSSTDIDFEDQIYIDDNKIDSSEFYAEIQFLDSIENPYARDPGYIYFRSSPKVNVKATWTSIATEQKARFNFK